jgi:transcriptional regulator with XRE-family HTH domain
MIETKIQFLRQARGLTQEGMAKTIGIRQDEYSRIERGNLRQKGNEALLKKIADALGVSMEDLTCPGPIVVQTGDMFNASAQLAEKDKEIAALKTQLLRKDNQIEKLLELLSFAGGGG